jgi:hypothetical protein
MPEKMSRTHTNEFLNHFCFPDTPQTMKSRRQNELRQGIWRHPNARIASCCGRWETPNGHDESVLVDMITVAELRRTHERRVDLLKLDIDGAEIDLFNACFDEELQSVTQTSFTIFSIPDRSQVAQILRRTRDIGSWILPFWFDNTNVLFVNSRDMRSQ